MPPMNRIELLKALRLKDPFLGLTRQPGASLWGWNGIRPIFGKLIEQQKPRLVIEVGAWLGLSTVTLARELNNHGLFETPIITIDTWLGSKEHWVEEHLTPHLGIEHGFPTLYPRFINNMIAAECTERVIPLPMPSLMAARFLKDHPLQSELMYIDGSHDEKDVYDDLTEYWPLLAPGGIVFGDDWIWDSVRGAVLRFAHEHGITPEVHEINWMIKKPRA